MRQVDLARTAGISQGYLSNLEAGKSTPTVDVAMRLADVSQLPML